METEIETTEDAVLGGRLRLRQPVRGHRVGHDAILLAAATGARGGEHAVDLGAGVGAAGLALAARVTGLKVTLVEVRDVILPETMKRAMAKQAEVERERRAKVINAEGEYQAAEKLVLAGQKIATQPVALQLRFLQVLTEVAAEHNSTTVFPVPIDMITPFLRKQDDLGIPTRAAVLPEPAGHRAQFAEVRVDHVALAHEDRPGERPGQDHLPGREELVMGAELVRQPGQYRPTFENG